MKKGRLSTSIFVSFYGISNDLRCYLFCIQWPPHAKRRACSLKWFIWLRPSSTWKLSLSRTIVALSLYVTLAWNDLLQVSLVDSPLRMLLGQSPWASRSLLCEDASPSQWWWTASLWKQNGRRLSQYRNESYEFDFMVKLRVKSSVGPTCRSGKAWNTNMSQRLLKGSQNIESKRSRSLKGQIFTAV